MKSLKNYKEIFKMTPITYWPHFLKHTYLKKKNDPQKYLQVPCNLQFNYLCIDSRRMKKAIHCYANSIIEKAESICVGHTSVFERTTDAIKGNWNKDPVTGYEWPLIYYKDVRKITSKDTIKTNSDIKYPWELSCSHHLVILAEAYSLTQSMKYLDMYFALLEDWFEENPVGRGVNWCCTMDVALRAINIIVSASIFNEQCPEFDKRFRRFYGGLYTHMLFIRDNLEYGFVRENHYLSDITGLKMLAQCFYNDRKGEKIYNFSARSFKEEMIFQVYPDGTDHEASTCYHCFVLELFLVGLATDYRLRKNLSLEEWTRLCEMVKFSDELCGFERYPIIGDNDSGRVLDLNGTGSFRQAILDFGKLLVGFQAVPDNEYSFLIDGDLQHKIMEPNTNETKIYKYSGYVIYNNDDFRLLVHSGDIGRKGKGGHGHNDQSAFVMDVKGNTFIIDPGSAVYERNLDIRHQFRGTGIHNCIMLEEREQNPISKLKPFKMEHITKATIALEEGKIICRHQGYESLGLQSKRSIYQVGTSILVEDEFIGGTAKNVSCLYTFAEDIEVSCDGKIIHAVFKDNTKIDIYASENCKCEIVEGQYSPDYGVIKNTKALFIKNNAPIDFMKITFTLVDME